MSKEKKMLTQFSAYHRQILRTVNHQETLYEQPKQERFCFYSTWRSAVAA
jgi:hypothetical protein